MGRLIGWLGTCSTPYCGAISGYFCVRCRHYVTTCRCLFHEGGCTCDDANYSEWWAGPGERRMLKRKLALKEASDA